MWQICFQFGLFLKHFNFIVACILIVVTIVVALTALVPITICNVTGDYLTAALYNSAVFCSGHPTAY